MMNLFYEKKYFKTCNIVGGIDEAGRGPLAGPVVAACVVIDSNFKINNKKLKLVNDSKQVSPKLRKELFDIIISEFPNIGVGICSNEEIDKLNVLQATLQAMRKAVEAIKMRPDILLIDGKNIIANFSTKQRAIIKGDTKVFLIAVASIVAKVKRDELMLRYHELYPEYGFDHHKGYGTKQHLESLQEHGLCKIHRLSFSPVARVAAQQKNLLCLRK